MNIKWIAPLEQNENGIWAGEFIFGNYSIYFQYNPATEEFADISWATSIMAHYVRTDWDSTPLEIQEILDLILEEILEKV